MNKIKEKKRLKQGANNFGYTDGFKSSKTIMQVNHILVMLQSPGKQDKELKKKLVVLRRKDITGIT